MEVKVKVVKVKVKVNVKVKVGAHSQLEKDHLVPSPRFRIFNSFWELAQAAAETGEVRGVPGDGRGRFPGPCPSQG